MNIPTLTLNRGLCRDENGGGGLAVQIARLEEQRDATLAFIEQTCAEAATGQRDLSATELATLESSRTRVTELDQQLAPMREFAALRAAHTTTTARFRPTTPASDASGGSSTGAGGTSLGAARTAPRGTDYRTRGQVIVDILRAAPQSRGGYADDAARDRLLAAGVYAGADDEQLRAFAGGDDSQVRAIAQQVTADTPGLLPTPIVGQVMSDLDAARPFISSIGARDMSAIPGRTFSRPIITQHTQAGKQANELTELASRKFKVDGVDFVKETHGGALEVARQEIDWTSPAAWDALLTDLQEVYAIDTEDAAAAAFAAEVTGAAANTVELQTNDLDGWILALYQAAAGADASVRRLPNAMWVSLDRWATIGAIIDQIKAKTGGNGGGDSQLDAFAGNMLHLPRFVVPSFPDGTVIVGVKERTEFYEQRIGLLSAVEPRLLGVEIAYGGYIAYGTLNAKGFRAIVNEV